MKAEAGFSQTLSYKVTLYRTKYIYNFKKLFNIKYLTLDIAQKI
jgi:hypothetical protein